MDIRRLIDSEAIGVKSARFVAEEIISAVARQGSARVVLATGASQFNFLDSLIKDWNGKIPWDQVT